MADKDRREYLDSQGRTQRQPEEPKDHTKGRWVLVRKGEDDDDE